MKIIIMFRFGIPSPQPLFPNFLSLSVFIIIIIIMFSWCFKQILSCHRIRLIVCTIQRIIGECCLGERFLISWSCYGLKWGIPWKYFVCFLSILFILYLPNVSKNYNHDTVWDYFSAQHKIELVVLFDSTLCLIMDLLRPKTGNLLALWFWFISIFIIWCLPVHDNHKHVQC